jgi:hypothetical protein
MKKLYINVIAYTTSKELMLSVNFVDEKHPSRFKNYYKKKRSLDNQKDVKFSTFKVTDIDDINKLINKYLDEGYKFINNSFEGTFDISEDSKFLVYKDQGHLNITLDTINGINVLSKTYREYNPQTFEYNDYKELEDYCNKVMSTASYSWFSNLKSQLYSAPTEVKRAFNEVVQYFAEIGEKDTGIYAVCTGSDPNLKSSWKVVDSNELQRMTKEGYTKSTRLN